MFVYNFVYGENTVLLGKKYNEIQGLYEQLTVVAFINSLLNRMVASCPVKWRIDEVVGNYA